MPDRLSRRSFLGVTGGAAVAAALPSAPAVHRARVARSAAVSSSNGLRAVNRAMELVAGGTDTLDAAVEGVKIQELDPADNSVGYGGLPNEDGVVQLD
ncbi:MAG: twin-arginine translocation signal domain-containing protein, partial [Gammaproteobacteria bacterium]